MALTNNEFAVLGLVAERPKHGYEIEQDIEQRGMREWAEIGFSSIYYLLNKLETAGLLSSEIQNKDDSRTRKVYQLTKHGRAIHLEAVRERLRNPSPHNNDFDLALANLDALPSAERLSCLLIYRSNLRKSLRAVQGKWREQNREGLPLSAEAIFSYSVAMLQAKLDWVSSLIRHLENHVAFEPPTTIQE